MVIRDLSGGTGALTVTDLNGGTAAADLKIARQWLDRSSARATSSASTSNEATKLSTLNGARAFRPALPRLRQHRPIQHG